MDMVYDALLSLISLVLLAMTLIVAAGILVTIPAHIMFATFHLVSARKHKEVYPTRPIRGRPALAAFALARERKPSNATVATPHEKKAA